jgi:hypothetical protein
MMSDETPTSDPEPTAPPRPRWVWAVVIAVATIIVIVGVVHLLTGSAMPGMHGAGMQP